MRQSYKIFINDIPIILTAEDSTPSGTDKDALIVTNADSRNIKDAIEYAEAHPFHSHIILQNSDIQNLFKAFKKFFVIVEASGGMVWSKEKALLLIFRHNKWDLPKGKIEDEEAPEETALREVKEECGIQELTLNEFIKTSYHTYWQHDNRFLKITYWFELLCNDPQNINPQTEEGIETIRWMDANGLHKALENTFPNLRTLFRLGLEKMKKV